MLFPTDGAKLMKHDLVSWVKRIQMDPNSRLSTCIDEKTAPSKVVTGVVPATTSLMPKSERENAFSNKDNSSITMSFYKSAHVPSVDNVGVLYRLPWILAVVVVNAFLGNAFA